mmetsp:Transcript_14864/g.25318  ORF Transcript_14864/g.25318 Transcript_14864/m.25318 type:complete len:92 (+) Transcript_14864:987-1262(+)
MIQRIQRNIIENPSDDKFKQIRPSNLKVKEALTKHYNGLLLLKLIGFSEIYDQTQKETLLKMSPSISLSYLKRQKLDVDLVINQTLRAIGQ